MYKQIIFALGAKKKYFVARTSQKSCVMIAMVMLMYNAITNHALGDIMENNEHLVDFNQYCCQCKHQKVSDTTDPCDTCLTSPTNVNSRKPILFEKKESES